ncbi:hypothetical protein FRB96_001360 [Tulasnella sp. 330]|nr:hypothetical protein FRB96_001360 [Tulasnella sp. 330]KAG8878524.1 hypothetical protein FRB97_002434 [Tulasnella sp. 331]
MAEAFRKIDIDAYDEDVLLESDLVDPDPRDPATVLSDAKSKSGQVRGFLSKGDIAGALTMLLADTPYGPNVEDAKAVTFSAVVLILNSTKSSDIASIVRSISQDSQDTLMKYLYKGMAIQGDSEITPSVLLSWHEKLTDIAGTGCIVRVMTDRRVV